MSEWVRTRWLKQLNLKNSKWIAIGARVPCQTHTHTAKQNKTAELLIWWNIGKESIDWTIELKRNGSKNKNERKKGAFV